MRLAGCLWTQNLVPEHATFFSLHCGTKLLERQLLGYFSSGAGQLLSPLSRFTTLMYFASWRAFVARAPRLPAWHVTTISASGSDRAVVAFSKNSGFSCGWSHQNLFLNDVILVWLIEASTV